MVLQASSGLWLRPQRKSICFDHARRVSFKPGLVCVGAGVASSALLLCVVPSGVLGGSRPGMSHGCRHLLLQHEEGRAHV